MKKTKMINIFEDIYVGDIDDFHSLGADNKDWAFVHSTQTVHYNIFGWDDKYNKPERDHEDFLYYEEDNRLSINWVDGPAVFFEETGIEPFIEGMDFIEKWSKDRKVLIHCDQGVSRSPTLALLYLAKRTDCLSNQSYEKAKEEFLKIYPHYFPGGIADYVTEHWQEIK